MEDQIDAMLTVLGAGGIFVYPLIVVGVIAIACAIDRLYVYLRWARLPAYLTRPLANAPIDPDSFQRLVAKAAPDNYYVRFFAAILANSRQPVWLIESRAADEAALIERRLDQGLWILETVVTAAPLLGLLGTITGMIGAFRLFGASGAVDPAAVTGGVAEALIATAIGIVIALLALAAYNYFSHRRAIVLDEMERLGTRLIDRIRMSQGAAP
jgi:biopolymer transport protein ExbB